MAYHFYPKGNFELKSNDARKSVPQRSGGLEIVLDPVAELTPLDDFGQPVLAVEFAPFRGLTGVVAHL